MYLSMPYIAKRVLALAMICSMAVLASCSAFDNRWNTMAPPQTANPESPLAGKWEGSWQSDQTAYIGRLRAIIVPTEAVVVQNNVPAQQYMVELKQSLYEVGAPEYSVKLNANKGQDGRLHFQGKKDMGGYPSNGIVYFDGYIEGDKFFCDYTSERDCGTFKMRRIVGENQ